MARIEIGTRAQTRATQAELEGLLRTGIGGKREHARPKRTTRTPKGGANRGS